VKNQGKVVIWFGGGFWRGDNRVWRFQGVLDSLLMLALAGAADTVSTILRQTIRQLSTPNNLRGG